MNLSPAPILNSFRVQSLLEQAEFWVSQQRFARAGVLFLEAIRQDPGGKARMEYAAFLYRAGEESAAIEQLSQVLEMARRENQNALAAAACDHLAAIYRDRGEWAAAKSWQQQAIAARLREEAATGADCFPAGDFLALANDAVSQGDLDYAERLAVLARNFSETCNSPADLADAWGTSGAIAFLQNELHAAWGCFLKAYFFHCRADDGLGRLMDLLNLANVSRERGWWELAKRLLVKAQTEALSAGHPRLSRKIAHLLEEAECVLSVAQRTPEWN